jgi:hypothetical protein
MLSQLIGFLYVYSEINFLDDLLSVHIDNDNEYFSFEVIYMHPITEVEAETDVMLSFKSLRDILSSSNLWFDSYLNLTVKEFLLKIDSLGLVNVFNEWLIDSVYDDPSVW